MARVLVFDANETLLDLSALRGPFAQAFGDAGPARRMAAYVARTDLPFALGRSPDLAGPDLSAVADAILAVDETTS